MAACSRKLIELGTDYLLGYTAQWIRALLRFSGIPSVLIHEWWNKLFFPLDKHSSQCQQLSQAFLSVC